jgi:hypothetical protein
MSVIQADFAPQRTFDYKTFRAEFVRRKRQSSYQRVNENGAKAQAAMIAEASTRVNEDGVPNWAEYQDKPGIMNTVHVWKAERFHDPNTMLCDEQGIRIETSGRVRYTYGLLEQVKNIYDNIEPDAIACIDSESKTWVSAQGRTYLTSEEFRILNLSKRYLAEGDHFDFKVKYQGMEARYTEGGALVEEFMHRWISRMTGLSEWHIELALAGIDTVYALRAMLGMDTTPEIRVVPRIDIITAKYNRDQAA